MQFPFAKKSLGQNFLTSQGALADIITAAKVKEGDRILEIGPGRGALTSELLKAGAFVTAIEKDRELVPLLHERFAGEILSGKLEIIEADIVEFSLDSYARDLKGGYKLVANIPYYLTGLIFRMFLEGASTDKLLPLSMTLLVQKEVAERIVAKDGKESILSFSIKAYGTPKYISTVKRGSFQPVPNVDSAILHIGAISHDFFSHNVLDEKVFFTVLKAAFAHKRKIVSNNLQEKGLIIPDEINKKARAEDLTLLDFISITKANLSR